MDDLEICIKFLKKRLTLLPLLIYWPLLFVLTHIPLPDESINIESSDFSLHFTAFIILAFVLWRALSDSRKVNFCKSKVWWALGILVIYAIVDEWLQGFVNRTPDLNDFFGDIAGAALGFLILSVLPFWAASGLLAAAIIFVLRIYHLVEIPGFMPGLWFICYSILTLICLNFFKSTKLASKIGGNWIAHGIISAVVFLICVEIASALTKGGLSLTESAASLAGIVTAAVFFVGFDPAES